MPAKIQYPTLQPITSSFAHPATLGLLLAALLMGVLWSVIATSVRQADGVRAAAGNSLRERLACEDHALPKTRSDCVLHVVGSAPASRATRP